MIDEKKFSFAWEQLTEKVLVDVFVDVDSLFLVLLQVLFVFLSYWLSLFTSIAIDLQFFCCIHLFGHLPSFNFSYFPIKLLPGLILSPNPLLLFDLGSHANIFQDLPSGISVIFKSFSIDMLILELASWLNCLVGNMVDVGRWMYFFYFLFFLPSIVPANFFCLVSSVFY